MTDRTAPSVDELKRIARRMRVNLVRMIGAAGSGHPGGSSSEAELLIALYFRVLRHDAKNPNLPDRDRSILSKGHRCAAPYATYPGSGHADSCLLNPPA